MSTWIKREREGEREKEERERKDTYCTPRAIIPVIPSIYCGLSEQIWKCQGLLQMKKVKQCEVHTVIVHNWGRGDRKSIKLAFKLLRIEKLCLLIAAFHLQKSEQFLQNKHQNDLQDSQTWSDSHRWGWWRWWLWWRCRTHPALQAQLQVGTLTSSSTCSSSSPSPSPSSALSGALSPPLWRIRPTSLPSPLPPTAWMPVPPQTAVHIIF